MKTLFQFVDPLVVVLLYTGAASLCHAQALETETARTLNPGSWETNTSFELQTSSEGTERAVPFAFEYGVTNRLSVLVEPVIGTAIRPKNGPRASGFGDLEVTATYLVRQENGMIPALAFAGEVKIPTAKSKLIGTGKTDYAGYLIASKQFGKLDTHANLGYTIVGQPAGITLDNIFNFALAGQYHVNKRYEVFGEILGNTSSSPGAENNTSGESTVTPEASGGELVGTLGAGTFIQSKLFLYFGVSYDNNNAVLFHPGLTLRF